MGNRTIFPSVIIAGFLILLLSAFTWPWEKEKEEIPQKETEITAPVAASEEKAGPKTIIETLPPPVSDIPLAIKTTELVSAPVAVVETVPNIRKISKTDVPAVSAVSSQLPKPIPAPRLSTNVIVVQDEIRQVIQLNRQRQMALQRQMKLLNERVQKAKIYNKILSNMYPLPSSARVSARAVNQQKIRLIHQEIKTLAGPADKVIRTVRAAQQSQKVAAAAKKASVLPIGPNAPKSQTESS